MTNAPDGPAPTTDGASTQQAPNPSPWPQETGPAPDGGGWRDALMSPPGLYAIAAGLFGAGTGLAIVLSRPGWDRLETAALLLIPWLLFGLAWAVAFMVAGFTRPAPVARRWLWTPVVVVACAVFTIGATFATTRLQGDSAQLEISPMVNNARLHVAGSTDLPDGSLLWIGAHHADQWMIGTGREVTVSGGTFATELDLDRWPRGPIVAMASFSMDDDQPPAAIERFGAAGERLFGRNVREDSDGVVSLQVSASAELRDGLEPDDPRALREPAMVSIMVTDAADELVEEAVVRCLPADESVDLRVEHFPDEGPIQFCTMQPGVYDIVVSAPGYRSSTLRLTVDSGDYEDVTVVLELAS